MNSQNSIATSEQNIQQLNSTASVFCEACNQIVKAYLSKYHENNLYQSINLSFAKKVLRKIKFPFSQFVVTLVYLNRYYQSCTTFNKHIPGHEEAIIPSLSHVVLLCIIQAERYITDTPHKLSWWAGICAGQTKSSDINKWQQDFFTTIKYKLYVHPEKDYNIFKNEIKRLAARLIKNKVQMPPQFRRSVNLGSQVTPAPASSHSFTTQQIPSQPNMVVPNTTTSSVSASVAPRMLLSPHYSGRSASAINTSALNASAILSNQRNMLRSPIASMNSDNNSVANTTTQPQIDIPVLNITNTNLISSPAEITIENSMINQTRSPNSIYTNSNHSYHIELNETDNNNTTSPLPPIQNPSLLMVHSKIYSPNGKTSNNSSLLVLPNNGDHTNSLPQPMITQSPVQLGNNITSSPVQEQEIVKSPESMVRMEEMEPERTIVRPIKRKRIYDPFQESEVAAQFLRVSQNFKRAKFAMTISPEELDFQPHTPSRPPIEENNKKENSPSFLISRNHSLMISPSIHANTIQNPSSSQKSGEHSFFQSIDKGKKEAVSVSGSPLNPIKLIEESITGVVENRIQHPLETIPNSTTQERMNSNVTNSEDLIVSSLLLATNNSTSITLIPVSPPLTPL